MLTGATNHCCRSLIGWLLAAVCAQAQTVDEPLIRTRMDGYSLCSLTGRWLAIDDTGPPPVRAWAGIVTNPSGGPARRLIQQRHREWVRNSLTAGQDGLSELTGTLLKEEMQARVRHCGSFQPQYFDGVLLEFPKPVLGLKRFCWVVDYDIDGSLQGETHHFVSEPLILSADGAKSADDRLRIHATIASDGQEFLFRYAKLNGPQPRASHTQSADNKPTKSADARAASPAVAAMPDHILTLVKDLHRLDNVRTRKQHLEKVVQVADEVIAFIEQGDHASSWQDTLADALYRKGRALGYMELPDVVAVKPVKDPVALNAKFEATFQRLDFIVDTTAPEYILLRIRRERRRDRRGAALDLVHIYRRTHPDPVWHYKKRYDLLAEIGAEFHAHQAAAQMWLHARQPKRPVPVVFRVGRIDSAGAVPALLGTWLARPPYREATVSFQQMPNGDREGVLWLDEGKTFELEGMATTSGTPQFVTSSGGNVINVTPADAR